jgi:hypothetical protein
MEFLALPEPELLNFAFEGAFRHVPYFIPVSPWRAHSCLPRPHSWGRLALSVIIELLATPHFPGCGFGGAGRLGHVFR